MRSRDTSDAASEVQLAVYRSMSPIRRLEVALAMSDEVMAVTTAGIRHRHPELTEDEVILELHRLLGHDELAS